MSRVAHYCPGAGLGVPDLERLEDARAADELAQEIIADYLTGVLWFNADSQSRHARQSQPTALERLQE